MTNEVVKCTNCGALVKIIPPPPGMMVPQVVTTLTCPVCGNPLLTVPTGGYSVRVVQGSESGNGTQYVGETIPSEDQLTPVPAGEPLKKGQLYLLVFDQRGFGSSLDSHEEVRRHFYAAEQRAYNGYIVSDIVDVAVSRERKDWDYLVAVKVGKTRWAVSKPPTAWAYIQSIADEWSKLVHGYVLPVDIYYTKEENPIPPVPEPEPSPWADVIKWGAIAVVALAALGIFRRVYKLIRG